MEPLLSRDKNKVASFKFKTLILLLLSAYSAQRASRLWATGFNFNSRVHLSGKVLTPNGDGANDVIFFGYDNPMDSQVTLRIFSVNGALIASHTSNAGDTQLSWNGKDTRDESVRAGIYIYSIESEGKVFHGTIIVVR